MQRALLVSVTLVGILASVAAGTAACSDSNDGAPTPDAAVDSTVTEEDAGADTSDGKYMPAGYARMEYLSTEAKHEFTKAAQVIEADKAYVAVLETDVGSLTLDLYADETPKTVNSFVFLALNHFYEGIAFHRVMEGFMAQTGDPNSLKPDSTTNRWGTGGCGYQFGLEVKASLKFDAAGVLGMARANDPNSNGSQFFITFNATPNLDTQYTVWGKVTEGLDVLPKIVRGVGESGMVADTPSRIVEIRIGSKAK